MAYQIERGITLGATLETLDQIAQQLQGKPDRDFIHGNLDLTNILPPRAWGAAFRPNVPHSPEAPT